MEQSSGYPQIRISRKTGDEPFCSEGHAFPLTLRHFWQWSASDLVSNATRGILAEFIVASALGLADGTRAEWDPVDLHTASGRTIEVKSAAYLQSWYHARLSDIVFGIAPTLRWCPETNALEETAKRQAEIYVFCVLKHQDKSTVDPLNLDQWDFYVLPTTVLDKHCPTQRSIRLSALLQLEPRRATYHQLADTINALLPASPAENRSNKSAS